MLTSTTRKTPPLFLSTTTTKTLCVPLEHCEWRDKEEKLKFELHGSKIERHLFSLNTFKSLPRNEFHPWLSKESADGLVLFENSWKDRSSEVPDGCRRTNIVPNFKKGGKQIHLTTDSPSKHNEMIQIILW